MTDLDPTTGFPAAPEGHVWKVDRNYRDQKPSGLLLELQMEFERTVSHYEKLSWLDRLFGRKPTPPVVDIYTRTVMWERVERKSSTSLAPVSPEELRAAALRILARYKLEQSQKDTREQAYQAEEDLIGVYPPKVMS